MLSHPRFNIRGLFVLVTLVSLACYAIHWKMARFEVVGLVLVRFGAPLHTLPPVAPHWPEYENGNWDRFLPEQREMILSTDVLSAALDRKDVASRPFVRHLDDPIAWFRERLIVENPQESEIMTIQLIGNRYRENPEDCAAVVAAVCEEYIDRNERVVSGRVKLLQVPVAR